MSEILELLNRNKEYAINLRREFHMHPEPSLNEQWTASRIEKELDILQIPHVRIAKTGIVATLQGTNPGKTIALRADTDALELQEQNTCPYASQKDGVMHACGHDAHIASLLNAAFVLKNIKTKFNGTIKFIFQPAEENAQGAKLMIKEGVLNGVDGIFGIHIWNDIDIGKMNIDAGPRMAAASMFKIKVIGKGGHGALPHQCVDAIVVAAAIVNSFQSIVAREINPLQPAVVTVGSLHAGSRFNIIADEALLEGTTRCYDEGVSKKLHDAMERQCKNIAKAYNADVQFEDVPFVIPTVNNPTMAQIGQTAAAKLFGKQCLQDFEKLTGGEDFSFFGKIVPAAFAFVGSKNEAKHEYHPHHHPKFDIDEDSITYAAGLYAQFALDFLSGNNL